MQAIHRKLIPTTAVAVLLSLTGCGSGFSSAPQPSAKASSSADAELVALVPDEVKQAGKIRVATDPTYAPFESIDTDGKTIIGLDPDLAHAVGGLLDLEIELVPTSFDGIIPSLAARKVDMAMAALGDTKEREQIVDFTTLYWNGTLLLVSKGNPKSLSADQTCGSRIGVIRGSLQQTTFLPGQEEPCKAAGREMPSAEVYQNASQAELALQSNRIDGVMLDAPALVDAAENNPDKFEAVGPLLKNPNPGGAAFPKDSKLTEAVQGAINKLIDSGTYQQILEKWKLEAIKIDKSEINGALS